MQALSTNVAWASQPLPAFCILSTITSITSVLLRNPRVHCPTEYIPNVSYEGLLASGKGRVMKPP
jgi:hypothetical protein